GGGARLLRRRGRVDRGGVRVDLRLVGGTGRLLCLCSGRGRLVGGLVGLGGVLLRLLRRRARPVGPGLGLAGLLAGEGGRLGGVGGVLLGRRGDAGRFGDHLLDCGDVGGGQGVLAGGPVLPDGDELVQDLRRALDRDARGGLELRAAGADET